MNETRNIVENTLQEYKQKSDRKNRRPVKVKCVAEFLDKIKNEKRSITIERYNIIGELNKIMQSSKGMIKLIRVIHVKIIIEREIYNIIMNIYFKSGSMPILWRKFYVKTVNERENLYNRPNVLIQHGCEKAFL